MGNACNACRKKQREEQNSRGFNAIRRQSTQGKEPKMRIRQTSSGKALIREKKSKSPERRGYHKVATMRGPIKAAETIAIVRHDTMDIQNSQPMLESPNTIRPGVFLDFQTISKSKRRGKSSKKKLETKEKNKEKKPQNKNHPVITPLKLELLSGAFNKEGDSQRAESPFSKLNALGREPQDAGSIFCFSPGREIEQHRLPPLQHNYATSLFEQFSESQGTHRRIMNMESLKEVKKIISDSSIKTRKVQERNNSSIRRKNLLKSVTKGEGVPPTLSTGPQAIIPLKPRFAGNPSLDQGYRHNQNTTTVINRQQTCEATSPIYRKSVLMQNTSLSRLGLIEMQRRGSSNTSLLDTSYVIENTSVIATRDTEGNKYINQYMVLEVLGKGSFGVVRLCFDTKLHLKVAMKIVNKARLKKLFIAKDKSAFKLVENEIAVMKKMCHPNVVKLYEIIDDPNHNKLYLVMQYVSKGSLLQKIKLMKKIPEPLAWRLFRDLISGLEYCHEVAGIIHRDIKPENLLLGESDCLYLSDFGIAFMIENGSDTSRATFGSSFFMAPEICKGTSYKGRLTDIWAAGVTLYYMLTGQLPFTSPTIPGLHEAIINSAPDYPSDLGRDPEERKDLIILLEGMLAKKAENRFTIAQIKSNDWVTRNGTQLMSDINFTKIEVNEDDKSGAIHSLAHSMAMARIKSVFKKALWRARVRITARKSQAL